MTADSRPPGRESAASLGYSPRAMSSQTKRIAVLTGGGDCPGLNAVIRVVTLEALAAGIKVVGIEDGFEGLVEGRIRPLGLQEVSGILDEGGTILGSSNRCDPSRYLVGHDGEGRPVYEDRVPQCLERIESEGIDALVVIGGDGTMTCAQPFVEAGLRVIGVPKTIDNDIEGTEITFGFLTAVQIATEALDRVRTTADSHGRVLTVEVMGRNAGWIALYSGIAGAADQILIPEIEYDVDAVADHVRRRVAERGSTVLCVAEGARPIGGEQVVKRIEATSPDPIRLGGVGNLVAHQIEEQTGIEARSVVLGHLLRGGSPTAADRVLATNFGHHAIELLLAGETARMVARQGGEMTSVDMRLPAGRQRLVPPDHSLVRTARGVWTGFGDRNS